MSTRDVSRNQEKQIAKKLNGKVQSNSGGTNFGGGDVCTDQFLIEAKTSMQEKKSFAIKKEWIDKAKQQAFEQRKPHWALAIRFDPDTNEDFFVINDRLMKILIEKLDEEDNGNG